MSWHERRPVDNLIDFDDGEKAVVVLRKLSEIRRFGGEVLRYRAIRSGARTPARLTL